MLDDSHTVFVVVVNDKGQYSIWPAELSMPGGWRREGFEGTRERCLEHVASVWTDMRPSGPASSPVVSPGTRIPPNA